MHTDAEGARESACDFNARHNATPTLSESVSAEVSVEERTLARHIARTQPRASTLHSTEWQQNGALRGSKLMRSTTHTARKVYKYRRLWPFTEFQSEVRVRSNPVVIPTQH